MAPLWFAVVIIPIALVVIFLWGRNLKRVNDKVKSGRAEWTDDWDPFE